jgi:hypothetical protein
MENNYGKLRNYIFYSGLALCISCSFTQLLEVPDLFSFYLALVGLILFGIGGILSLFLYLNKK